MKYALVKIRTKEMQIVKNNCIGSLIKGFIVEPIESINAEDVSEAIKTVMKNHEKVLSTYEFDSDYNEWFKKSMSEDGKTIFASLYALVEEGEVIDWRYNG